MGTPGAHARPPVAPPQHPGLETLRGEDAGPPLPQAPPNGHPGQWIVVGPRTRAHLARVLEQLPHTAPVLVALLETSGVPEGQGWRLCVDAAHLEPEPPRGGPPGGEAPLVITTGAMRLPQPEPLDDLQAFLRGLQPDGGYWEAMRRLADHDHSGGLMGAPVAGAGGEAGDVTLSGTEGVTVAEGPANTFALGLTASPDANNTVEIRANGIYSAAGAIPPEVVTDAELATALGPYATDADLADHAAAANPHPVYLPLAGGTLTGLLTVAPASGTTALNAAGEVFVGGSARAGVLQLRDWSTALRWGLGLAAASPNDDFYLWDYPGGAGRLQVGAGTGTLTLTPAATQPALAVPWGDVRAGAGANLQLRATSALELEALGGTIAPPRDNTVTLGWSGGRWAAVYAVAGAINTSSRAYKEPAGDLDPERALAAVLRTPARRFAYTAAPGRVQSGYYLEEADPLFAIGPDEASASNDAGVVLAAVQALAARVAALEAPAP